MYKLITSSILDDKWVGKEYVIHMPLLSVEYTDNLPDIDMAKYDDIIITSRHAFIALQNLSAQNLLKDKKIVVVGYHTGLMISPFFQVAAKFDNVAALIDHYNFLPHRRILYLRGQVVKKSLSNLLPQHHCKEIVVYNAVLLPSIPEDVRQKLENGEISDVLLYSSRSAKHFFALARQKYINNIFNGKTRIHFLSKEMAEEFAFLPNYKILN